GMVEGFADIPRPPEPLGFALEIASCHVETGGVAINMVERPLGDDVATALGQGDHHFELVMHIGGFARIGKQAAARDKIVGIFLKEERRLAIGIVTHLDRVVGIVASDAINAMDREMLIGALDRKTWPRQRRKDVSFRIGHFGCSRAMSGSSRARVPYSSALRS